MEDNPLSHLELRTLRYLGFKGDPSEEQIRMIRDAAAEAKRFARPGFVYRYLELKKDQEGHLYVDVPLDISYPSLQTMLSKKDSDCICILVSTLGPAVDKRISDLSQRDSAGMLLLDAAANALIEEETNAFQKKLGLKEESFRYAPGYGDVPLSMQREIFDLMPEIAKLGIVLDDSNIMHPFKSMTGIIGFKDR